MKKILVIDDEEWLREMIQLALQQRGFQVIEAANGADGIELARKELPDLILCDINMGKVDGYLTLSSLRNEAPTAAIPFILMTGLADNASMRHGMELGADDYLPKPFTTEGLYAAVDARLKKSQTIRDEAERKLASLRDNISLMMPHEMRTPLNGILSNAELLACSAATLKPADVAEIGQEIHKSSERLARLIENFLIYAQLELVAADPKNVNALRVGRTEHPKGLIKNHATAQATQANRLPDLSLELADIPVPIAEELAFRSFLIRRIISPHFESVASRSVTLVPVLISAIAFGLLHGDRWLAGTIAGLLYAFAYLRRGRIGDAVAAHAATNALLAGYVLLLGKWSLW